MKKRLIGFLLVLVLTACLSVTALADSSTSSGSVTFTSEANIEDALPSLADATKLLQPGDDLTITVTLNNNNEGSVDWYMKNEVLSTLEDSSSASGGAYTYILSYMTSEGAVKEIFNSETVGGENPPDASVTGLKEINEALKLDKNEYIFLESMAGKSKGTLTLKVALDGETQGNDYANSQAKLRLKFAAELTQTKTVVKTGDDTNMLPYIIGMGVSGVLILLLAIDGVRRRRKNGGDHV